MIINWKNYNSFDDMRNGIIVTLVSTVGLLALTNCTRNFGVWKSDVVVSFSNYLHIGNQ